MFKKPFQSSALALLSLGVLAGCMTPVEDLKPTTFDAGTLDQGSTGRVVTILHLLPAKAQVSNAQNNEMAKDVGAASGAALCGAVGGALAGAFAGAGAGVAAGLGGAVLCGIAGSFIGGAIEPPELHPDSLIIVYQDPNDPQIKQTVEIAKPCEFKPGTGYAVVLKNPETGREETKIQPNNFQSCISYSQKLKATKAEDKEAKKIAEKEYKLRKKNPNAVLPPTELPAGDVTRVDMDGTVLLHGKYLGVADEEGVVTTLDKNQTVQIFRDGMIKNITNGQPPVILGQVPPDELEQIRACKNNLPNCKFNQVGW